MLSVIDARNLSIPVRRWL